MITRYRIVPEKYHIVGDPAFALHSNLLNRYPGLHLLPWESIYNYRQSRCGMVVESLFGRMKGKWRVLINPIPFRDLEVINKIILTCVLPNNFLLTKDDTILHPRHHFQDDKYRLLMKTLDEAKQKALEEANKSRKRKRTSLSAKEKIQVIASSFERDFSEENCVLFLGM
jgi:hypothetical protein